MNKRLFALILLTITFSFSNLANAKDKYFVCDQPVNGDWLYREILDGDSCFSETIEKSDIECIKYDGATSVGSTPNFNNKALCSVKVKVLDIFSNSIRNETFQTVGYIEQRGGSGNGIFSYYHNKKIARDCLTRIIAKNICILNF
ncbi:MAG: hypothetical protein Q7U04_14950 [Bacteriovorax sp.]|nr:hypothetical protein [Bacteriovorax sp.]